MEFLASTRDRFVDFRQNAPGLGLALRMAMPARRFEDLVAYQFSVELKEQIQKLLSACPEARSDRKYCKQLQNAASGVDGCIAEGFGRCRPTEFANFLVYAIASLDEVKARLKDGMVRQYFRESDCRSALAWAVRCREVTGKLLASQRRRIERDREARRRRRDSGKPGT